MPPQRQTQNPAIAYMIHLVFTASVPVYALVYYSIFLRPEHPAAGTTTPQTHIINYILISIAFVSAIGGLIIPGIMSRIMSRFSPASPLTPTACFVICIIKMIVSDAFFEAIAIYGLVGGFMQLPQNFTFLLMIVSFILLLINFARLRNWLEECTNLKASQ